MTNEVPLIFSRKLRIHFNREGLSQISGQPFYLWLLGISPILHLYAVNFGLVIDREVFTSCAVMLAATTIAFAVMNVLVGSRHKTACILSVASICFSLGGHLYLEVFLRKSLLVWTLAIAAFALFVMGVIYRSDKRKLFAAATFPLNLVSLALLAGSVTAIVSSYNDMSSFALIAVTNAPSSSRAKVADSTSHPDIYYIVPDGYPSDAWLDEAMGYDNSAFTRALEERGFVVPEHAQSNYGATMHSLASTLNMRFYDSNPTSMDDLDYLRLSVVDSEVAAYLQRQGYTYIQLMSHFFFPSSIADINRDFTPSGAIEIEVDPSDLSIAAFKNNSEEGAPELLDPRSSYKQSFVSLYLDTTLLRVLKSQVDKLFLRDEFMPYSMKDGERFLDTVANVAAIAFMPEATFTFAHLYKPHEPTVFNKQGDIIGKVFQPSAEEWLDELEFINSAFLEMVDAIIENSDNPPVILIQADHGSLFGKSRTADRRHIHFDVYAAAYLPEEYSLTPPRPFTLVNTFPLILNAIFDTDFELHPDRLFEVSSYNAAFDISDVTDLFLNK
ncbi:MAG: hypothetical protein OXG60_15680 [Chloroflexi bacterium]|nr:hypothetical protein [Chloroflexota bacterium]